MKGSDPLTLGQLRGEWRPFPLCQVATVGFPRAAESLLVLLQLRRGRQVVQSSACPLVLHAVRISTILDRVLPFLFGQGVGVRRTETSRTLQLFDQVVGVQSIGQILSGITVCCIILGFIVVFVGICVVIGFLVEVEELVEYDLVVVLFDVVDEVVAFAQEGQEHGTGAVVAELVGLEFEVGEDLLEQGLPLACALHLLVHLEVEHAERLYLLPASSVVVEQTFDAHLDEAEHLHGVLDEIQGMSGLPKLGAGRYGHGQSLRLLGPHTELVDDRVDQCMLKSAICGVKFHHTILRFKYFI